MTTATYQMDPMKKLQNLYSWSELYSMTKDKVKHDKIQLEISKLKDLIIKQNTINKN